MTPSIIEGRNLKEDQLGRPDLITKAFLLNRRYVGSRVLAHDAI